MKDNTGLFDLPCNVLSPNLSSSLVALLLLGVLSTVLREDLKAVSVLPGAGFAQEWSLEIGLYLELLPKNSLLPVMKDRTQNFWAQLSC